MSTDMILGVVMLAMSALPQAAEAAPGVQPAPSDLVTVVQRASAWVAGYVKALSSVVSEGRYQQIPGRNSSLKGFEPVANRTLLSDFLLVQVSGSSSWLPFRDVYSVDGRPVRDGRVDEDVPAKGRFWVDPADGSVLRTRLETHPNGGTNVIYVDYRHDQRLGVLVPHEMIEYRSAGAEVLEGRATYSNFRHFQVDTSIEIK